MELKFNNGKFRIMQIADIQDTQRTSDATVRFIREALKKAQPDLVVFTGDQIKGYGFNLMGGDNKKKVTECINKFLTPLDETGIPFTFVFGNHDDQAFSISKKEQLEIYSSHDNCAAFNADDNIDGYCNHNLEIKGEDGKTKLNVYLMDSLTSTMDGTCDHVHENQLEWYRSTREALKDENGDYIPSVVFQHIPVNEIYELIKSISYPNNKARNLLGMAKMLVSDFGGIVPDSVELLQKLPGVGRKTANVVASVAFDKPAMAVDTHVFRVSARIGLTKNAKNPLETERQLVDYFPENIIPKAHHWLILHGRYVCTARNPKCSECLISDICQHNL